MLVLSTNNWSVIKQQFSAIASAIEDSTPGSFVFLEIGHGRG
jgi:hypothetical protein